MNKIAIAPGKTLGDLYNAVLADPTLQMSDKARIIAELRKNIGAPTGTLLQDLLPQLIGLGLGILAAKYFGLGGLGTAISGAAGFGAGGALSSGSSRPYASMRAIEAFNF